MYKTYDLYTVFNDMCEDEALKNINVSCIVSIAIYKLFRLNLLRSNDIND